MPDYKEELLSQTHCGRLTCLRSCCLLLLVGALQSMEGDSTEHYVKRWVVGFSVGIMLSIGEIEGDVEVVNNFQIGLDSDF